MAWITRTQVHFKSIQPSPALQIETIYFIQIKCLVSRWNGAFGWNELVKFDKNEEININSI